jgi:hypothetical protein
LGYNQNASKLLAAEMCIFLQIAISSLNEGVAASLRLSQGSMLVFSQTENLRHGRFKFSLVC